MTEIERPFLAAKVSNTNLVQFLPLYHVIISNVHIIHILLFYVHDFPCPQICT